MNSNQTNFIKINNSNIQSKNHNLTINNNLTSLSSNNSSVRVNNTLSNNSNLTNTSVARNVSSIPIYYINEGEYANLSCSSLANPTAKFEWERDLNKTISHDSMIIFSPIKRKNSGAYICIAYNMVGNRSSTTSRIVVRCEYQFIYHFVDDI